VQPRDALALANALGELIEMGCAARRELGRAARQRILEHFSIGTIVNQYESLYQQTALTA